MAKEFDWGHWEFKASTIVLTNKLLYNGTYEVDLERMTTAAEVLDWIAQVAKKVILPPAEIGGLVNALEELLDLQHNFVHAAKRVDPVAVLKVRGHL